jgi:hypothetical protein
MTPLSTFDAAGRRRLPGRDWWPAVYLASLPIVAAVGGVAIAWVLDANLSPRHVIVGLVTLALLAGLFAAQHRRTEIEHAETLAEYRRELARERRANLANQLIIDDLTAEPKDAA